MALITTHTITTAGTAPTFGAAAADDTAETGYSATADVTRAVVEV